MTMSGYKSPEKSPIKHSNYLFDRHEENKEEEKKKKKGSSCFGFFLNHHQKVKKFDSPEFNNNSLSLSSKNGIIMTTSQQISMSKTENYFPDPFHHTDNNSDNHIDNSSKNIDIGKDSTITTHKHELVKIYNSSDSDDENHSIKNYTFFPCLLLQTKYPSSKILLYFHGNGEDINLAYDLLEHLRNHLNVQIIAVEYPGYGLYPGSPSEKKILSDAETVFDFVTETLKVRPQDIIIFGRSIGTGPATWLASRKTAGLLILMSAFTSIRKVAKHVAGSFAQYLIKERFKNIDNIKNVKCPVFFVHGQKDTLIPAKQSQQLYEACTSKKRLFLAPNMNHIELDYYDDLTLPLVEFLKEIDMNARIIEEEKKIVFPKQIFEIPKTNHHGQMINSNSSHGSNHEVH